MDQFKNFASSQLAAGITSADLAASVLIGDGARFPAAPFSATIWNKTDHANPSDDEHVEIVRVTATVGDVFTIVRAQEGTTAFAHNTASKTYGIVATLTAATIAQFAGNLPWVNARDEFGLSPLLSDNYARFQTGIDNIAAAGRGTRIVLPDGNLSFSQAIVIRSNGITIEGQGAQESAAPYARGTRLFTTSATDDVIRIDATASALTGIFFRDFSVSGAGGGGISGSGIVVLASNPAFTVSNFHGQNVTASNCKQHGIWFKGATAFANAFWGSLTNAKAFGNYGNGVRIESAAQIRLSSIYSDGNADHEIWIGGTAGAPSGGIVGMQITGAAAPAGKVGFYFGFVDGVDFLGVDGEANVGGQLIFDGAGNVRLVGGSVSCPNTNLPIVFSHLNGVSNRRIFIDLPGLAPLAYPSIDISDGGTNYDLRFGSDANGPMRRSYINFGAFTDTYPFSGIHFEVDGPSGYGGALTISSNVIIPTAKVHTLGAGLVKTILADANTRITPGWQFTIIPTAAFTTDTTGNIGKASVAVVGVAITFTWDGTKWWPSY